ncbi:tetratricopeptide repeat protein [Planctomycetaceae bacterium SH139]
MSNPHRYDLLSDESLGIIHRLSERFESALHHEVPVSLEDVLDSASADIVAPLFRELLEIELEWFAAQGQLASLNIYLTRFPDRQNVVSELYSETQLATPLRRQVLGLKSSTPLPSGTVIADRYILVSLIGEGGMGSVYLADQQSPVQRRVAIKLIKSGMDSSRVIARFNAERQALARMDHPHIAKIYDGGSGLEGQPFFVMELVDGLPITEFCDVERLTIRARLKLFASVCQAVQHAHTKGIIHRDLKPANVLVTRVNGQPQPKIIDFGVAKAIESEGGEQGSNATAFLVGTPAYMSPEQADPTSADVDARADVYSLGTILYELLVGSPPHEALSNNAAGVAGLLRMVRDSDSPRPSSKLSSQNTAANTAAKIADKRGIDPNKLSQLLRRELDWIVLRAVDRDRNQRYETADAFARDIQRYLDGDLVEAQPPTAGYRLRKLAIRHNRLLLAASLLVATLTAGVIGTSWGLLESRKYAKAARTELAEKQLALQNEAREREYAEAIADFLARDILALTSLEGRLDFDDQSTGLTKDSTLRELLDRAAEKLRTRDDLKPLTLARLQLMIGRSYRNLGEYEKAVKLCRQAAQLYANDLGPDDLQTLDAQENFATSLQAVGEHQQAMPIIEDILARKKTLLGEGDIEILSSMRMLAKNYRALGEPNEAVLILRRTLQRRQTLQGPTAHVTLTNMYDLAMALKQADQPKQAMDLLERTLALQQQTLGPDHPDTNTCSGQLGVLYSMAGMYEKAMPLVQREYEYTKDAYGEEHPNTIYALVGLAVCYRNSNQHEQAISLFEEALELVRKKFGSEHPNFANATGSLAMAYRAAGDHKLALPFFEQSLKVSESSLGLEHPSTLVRRVNLAACHQSLGNLERAQQLNEQCLQLSMKILTAEHSTTLSILQNLAQGYWCAGQYGKAIPLFERALKASEEKYGRIDPRTMACAANLGVNYRDAGRLADAVTLLEEAYLVSIDQSSLSFVNLELADAYFRSQRSELGLKVLEEYLGDVRKRQNVDPVDLATQLEKAGQILLRSGLVSHAEPLLDECRSIHDANEIDNWGRYHVMAMHGQVALMASAAEVGESGIEKLEQAELLLLDGLAGMEKREPPVFAQVGERRAMFIQCLIDIYAKLGERAKGDEWESKLKLHLAQ